MECWVLLVRVNSCDERVQGVFFGVVGGNAQRELSVVVGYKVGCSGRLPVCLVRWNLPRSDDARASGC